MSSILIVLSAADTWTQTDGTEYKTGFWAEELVVPHEKFVAAGHTVDIATPGGVTPSLDQHSVDPAIAGDEVPRYRAYLDSIAASLDAPLTLAEVTVTRYDAIFVPGGHGPVVDLFSDRALGDLLLTADDAQKVIASVCHGPAGLLSATEPDGTWRFAGRRVAAFTDDEEKMFGTADNAPWLLASRLRELGAQHESGAPWEPYTVVDGNLISGQNPASSAPVADAVVVALA